MNTARRLIAATVLSAAIVTGSAGVANARPMPIEEPLYCGPGYHAVEAHCARNRHAIDLTDAKARKAETWGWLLFGAAAVGSLLNPFG